VETARPSTGEYETHVTVAPTADADALRAFAAALGLKFTHIVLAQGAVASQPMFTRHGHGSLADEQVRAAELAAALRAGGCDVTRIKIEAAPWNGDVPLSDVDAAGEPAERYFEHHVKLLLPADADVAAIVAIARPHGAHVSRNALRQRGDGGQERFVTQRVHRQGAPAARAKLEALLSALRAARHEILDVEEEYVVSDTNLSLDAGWIDAAAAREG
jgi:hypothetical protein